MTTPVEIVRDYYAGGSVVFSGIKLAATLHKFDSDCDSLDYGNELDLVATYAITKNIDLLAKFERTMLTRSAAIRTNSGCSSN